MSIYTLLWFIRPPQFGDDTKSAWIIFGVFVREEIYKLVYISNLIKQLGNQAKRNTNLEKMFFNGLDCPLKTMICGMAYFDLKQSTD